MKLISWNVNGIRACINKGFLDIVDALDADIVCLQETKAQPDQIEIPEDLYPYQYAYSAVRKGYSGTMILSRIEPLHVSYGLGMEQHDTEGRVITAEFEDFYLVTVYTPNSGDGLKRLSYRMEWDQAFSQYVRSLKKPVLVCGDLNVANEEIDIKNPKTNRRNAGFTDEEREKMSILLDSGFIDSFRYFYPDLRDAYSWWSYMGRARENNTGWRIDYFLCSQILGQRLKDAKIYPEIFGSDHCPVGLELK